MVGVLRYCLFGLLSLSVLTAEAARQKPVVRPASAQDTFVKGQGTSGQQTLDIDRHWGEILDVPGGRVNLPVTQKSAYNPTRIAGAIKQLIKNNPLKVAGTAAGLYLIDLLPGSSFDPLTGQPLMTPPFSGSASQVWVPYGQPTPRYSSALEACKGTYGPTTILAFTVGCYHPAGSPWLGNVQKITVCTEGTYSPETNQCIPSTSVTPLVMTDPQLDQLVSGVPGFSESHWSEIGPILLSDIPATFDGPDSTAFDGPASVTGTPTITTTLDQVSGTSTVVESTPVHNFDFSTNPLSITTTTTTTNNTYQNGTLVSTTTQTQGQPSTEVSEVPAQLEIPTDCDFMPTVCSFIDWVKTPFDEEDPDLSELITDQDFEKEITFASNATCPPPANIDTAFGSYALSYEPGCQWASMIKPFILIAALISAIFINLGSFRGGD